MKYLLAHDLGTSGNKVTLFDETGRMLDSCVSAYGVHYFNTNWAEQDPEDWWWAFCDSTRRLIHQSGIAPEDIAGISFSGQMMGCTCVDREGNPLRPSIIWADSRASAQSAALEEKISQWDFYQIVGHRNTPSYGLQKLMWVRDQEPEIYEKTYKVLNAKDFIVMRLTGAFVTDYSDANSMACFDVRSLSWSQTLIDHAGIDKEKLPEVKPSTYIPGGITAWAAERTGLVEGTPVVLGGGDGAMANVGAGSIKPGSTYCCMGTSAWLATTTETPLFDPQMRTVVWAHVVPGLYASNGTMQTAGGALSWAKETFCTYEKTLAKDKGTSPYDYINAAVETSPAGANGLVFLPYLMGERAPRWNNTAKGSFIGLKGETTLGDVFRSVMEGVAMNLRIILDAMKSHMDIEEITVIGGGAKSQVWRQIMADIFETRIAVPALLEEAGAMGAAVTAGVGVGLYESFDAIEKFMQPGNRVESNQENQQVYKKQQLLFEECYSALKDIFGKL